MSFTVEEYADDHIIVLTLNEDYDLVREIPFSNQAVKDILSARDTRFTLITVIFQKLSIEEITHGANTVGRGRDSLWHHPRIRRVILVSDDAAIIHAAAGMASTAFGNLNVVVCESVDAALALARTLA